MRAATLFSGFDGAGEGMKAAGFEIAWGIELEDKIAQVARNNGHNVITANILEVDPRDMEHVDALHLSPPCTRASVANSSAEENENGLKEAPLDMDLATKSIRFIEALKPRIVTVENVWQYRKFQSYRGGKKCEGILPALERLGYWVHTAHVNAADFGVPQTRKRMIVRAVLGGWLPYLPEPEPWRGWYEAIEDLIPTLPEDEFAPWQIERLPEEMRTFMFAGSGNTNFAEAKPGKGARYGDEPAQTITAVSEDGGNLPRAFLVHPTDMRTMPIVDQDAPSFTVLSASGNTNLPRAYLVQGTNANGLTVNGSEEPSVAVMATSHSKSAMPRAFLVDGQNARPGRGGVPCFRMQDESSLTITSSAAKGYSRAWLSQGRVVKMTPRCLARFQSFADSYRLSGNNSLDCKGIGNACPPVMFKKIYQQLRDCIGGV